MRFFKKYFKKFFKNFKFVKNYILIFAYNFKNIKNKLLILIYSFKSFKDNSLRKISHESKIPPILFTSYLCDHNDDLVTKILKKWSSLNNDFQIKYFSDKDLEIFFQENDKYLETFKKLRNGVAKADFFRLVYLYEFGGYWFDFDLEPFRIIRPNKGAIHLFDMGFGNISYMLIGGISNKLFQETINEVCLNIDKSFNNKKQDIIDITGPRVMQKIVSEKLGYKLIDGGFRGKLKSKTFLKNTEYEFEYMLQLNMQLKTKLYNLLQKKYKKKPYQEYDFI